MGAFADSLFSALMSWVRALVSGIWALFNSERTTLLAFLGKNWIAIAVLMIAAGLVIDWLIWLIRWQPYHIWAVRLRRFLRIAPPQAEEETDAAYVDEDAYLPPLREEAYARMEEEKEQWMPLEAPEIDEAQVQQVLEAADQAPDERVYPGMRYDDARSTAEIQAQQDTQMDGTRRYAAVHAEGPGAAEVMRRRAEIDAWQEQMREEARQKAEAERAARLAQAERERRAAQEAYEAEQARLAQAEYERQLAEYERQRAQYERDLAQYEREKAEYEAAMARQAEEEAAAQRAMQESAMQESVMQMEAAQELAPESGVRRRRRSEAYSDYVEGETVTQLPDAPEWKPMEKMEPLMEDAQKKADAKAGRKSIWRSGMEMMAHMMEEEEQDITGIASLPPRVDMHEAYRPAKKPGKQ